MKDRIIVNVGIAIVIIWFTIIVLTLLDVVLSQINEKETKLETVEYISNYNSFDVKVVYEKDTITIPCGYQMYLNKPDSIFVLLQKSKLSGVVYKCDILN